MCFHCCHAENLWPLFTENAVGNVHRKPVVSYAHKKCCGHHCTHSKSVAITVHRESAVAIVIHTGNAMAIVHTETPCAQKRTYHDHCYKNIYQQGCKAV